MSRPGTETVFIFLFYATQIKMDSEAYDIMIRKKQRLQKVPVNRRISEVMPTLSVKLSSPTQPNPPPWAHIPELTYANSIHELITQRDEYLKHHVDMSQKHHDFHALHAKGELPLGAGKHLLDFPRKVNEIGEYMRTRQFQVCAASYSKAKLFQAYGTLRGYKSKEIQDSTPTARHAPKKMKKEKHDVVQMIVDDLEVDAEDMLNEIATTT